MDDDRNCKVGVNNFPSDKKMGGQTAQGLYETTLREEFAKMNELIRTNIYYYFGYKLEWQPRAWWTVWRAPWCVIMT
jgi:hypothetical protein